MTIPPCCSCYLALSLQPKYIILFWALDWMTDASFFGTVSGACSDLHFSSSTCCAAMSTASVLKTVDVIVALSFGEPKKSHFIFSLGATGKSSMSPRKPKWPQLLLMSVEFSLVAGMKCWQNHWWSSNLYTSCMPCCHFYKKRHSHAYHLTILKLTSGRFSDMFVAP